MAAPHVRFSEVDLSQRVPSSNGVYAAIQIPMAKRGVLEPVLVTSETQLLNLFTPAGRVEVGYDLAYYSALAYLQKSNKLWVQRVLNDDVDGGEAYAFAGSAVREFDHATNQVRGVVSADVPDADPSAVAKTNTVTGTGTVFSSELTVGDVVTVAGQSLTVATIVSDTEITVTEDITVAFAGEAMTVAGTQALTGTVGVADTSTTVSGTGTAFTTELTAGDVVTINGTEYTVASITDDSAFEATAAATETVAGLSATKAVVVTLTGTGGAVLIDPPAPSTMTVLGTDTIFTAQISAGDVVTINGVPYEVATVVSDTELTLTSGITGADLTNVAMYVEGKNLSDWDVGHFNPMVAFESDDAWGAYDAFQIFASDAGDWANDLSVRIVNYVEQESVTGTATGGFAVTRFWPEGVKVRVAKYEKAPSVNGVPTSAMVTNGDRYTLRTMNGERKLYNGSIAVSLNEGDSLVIVPVEELCKTPDAFALEVRYKGEAKEVFEVSLDPTRLNGFGRAMFIETVLEASSYVRAIARAGSSMMKVQDGVVTLAGGDDGGAVTTGNMIRGLDVFKNKDYYELTMILDGGFAQIPYQAAMLELAEGRQDCIAMLSVPYDKEASSNYMNEINEFRKLDANYNSSYGAIYTPHVKIYSKFTDTFVYVSPEAYAAAVISETASNREIWYPAAGFRRGMLNVLDVRRRYTQGEMDALYDAQINPLRFSVGRGILVWGQKTLLAAPSALDRLNVRLLLITIQPAIAKLLEQYVFEFNDALTRATITSQVNVYLENIQARRGLYDYHVICSDENNTPADIDNNKLNCWIFVKPTKSAEFVKLTTAITSTGMDFALAAEQL